MNLMRNVLRMNHLPFRNKCNNLLGLMQWWRSMTLFKNSAWEIVPRPVEKSVVGSRWIYKVKKAADGSVDKYKVIFVARGFS